MEDSRNREMRERENNRQQQQQQPPRPKSAPHLLNGEEEPIRPLQVTVSTLQKADDRKRVHKSITNDPVSVMLRKGNKGFGFSIRGGDGMPLFVLRIAEEGAAAIDGRIKVSVAYFIKVQKCNLKKYVIISEYILTTFTRGVAKGGGGLGRGGTGCDVPQYLTQYLICQQAWRSDISCINTSIEDGSRANDESIVVNIV